MSPSTGYANPPRGRGRRAEEGVEDVFLVGLATDYCVKNSALDAAGLGFRTTVIEDGCRGIELHEGDVAVAIEEMREAGVRVVPSMTGSFIWNVAILLMAITITCPMAAGAQGPAFDADSSSRGLLFGWGHSWGPGWPGWGHTETDIGFAAFHPQMGWFASDRLEFFGEGTLLAYHKPGRDISAGLVGIGGRYHFSRSRWAPYVTMGGGFVWTSLDIREIDRVFNFQVLYGAGIRRVRENGPGWRVEVRNHHISNAGTAGENFGINAITVLAGFDWILR